jgi:predicted nucleotidyltransferase
LAFIYGSYAKNKENKGSDIDLVVVGEVPNGEFTRDIRALEARLNREINYTAYEKEEFDKERKKKGGVLQLVLADKIILLKGELGAR